MLLFGSHHQILNPGLRVCVCVCVFENRNVEVKTSSKCLKSMY